MAGLITQNSLLLNKLLEFYNKDGNMEKILPFNSISKYTV